MDYGAIIELVAEIVRYAFPISLIFGFTAKACNLCFEMVFGKKLDF